MFLATWDKAYRESKIKLFYDFYNISPNWRGFYEIFRG